MGSERADAERRVAALQKEWDLLEPRVREIVPSPLLDQGPSGELALHVGVLLRDCRALADELRAAWKAQRDWEEMALIAERGRCDAYEKHGFAAGLAAARAALAKWRDELYDIRPQSKRGHAAEHAVALIDALGGREEAHE